MHYFNQKMKTMYPDVKFFLRKRYFVSMWTCMGFMLLVIFGSSMIIALVELTSEKTLTTMNGTIVKKVELDWDSRTNGLIIGSHSIGFFFSPVGGILAARYSGVTIFGLGLFFTALLTTLTPFLIRSHFLLIIFVRLLEGISESFSSSALINIFTHWAPPNERSRLVSFILIGLYFGVCVSYSLGGFLAQHFGVDSIFYVTGGAGLIWSVVWFSLVSKDPSVDRYMTSAERNYFKNYNYESKTQNISPKNYPWKLILTSKPAWAIFNEYFCFAWVTVFIAKFFPLYTKDTFNVNIESVGLLSSVPVLGNLAGTIIFSFIADYLRSNGIVRIATIHRLFAAIGQLSCAVFLLLICTWANFIQSIILFTFMRFFAASAELTYHVALIDMFCEYSGIVKGLAGFFFTLASFLTPIVMGFMVTNQSQSSWNLYFLFLSIFNVFGFIIFYIFGSGELQEWADPNFKNKSDRHNPIQLEDM